jgi:hypothetical protein
MHPTICRISWVTSFLLIIVVLTFMGGEPPALLRGVVDTPSDSETYAEFNGAFAIEYPADWTVFDALADISGEVSFFSLYPAGSFNCVPEKTMQESFALATSESSLTQIATLEEFSRKTVVCICAETAGKDVMPEVISDATPVEGPKLADGRSAWRGYRTEYVYKLPDDPNTKGHVLLVVLEAAGQRWVLQGQAAHENWDALKGPFDHMIATFRPGGGGM